MFDARKNSTSITKKSKKRLKDKTEGAELSGERFLCLLQDSFEVLLDIVVICLFVVSFCFCFSLFFFCWALGMIH